MNSPENSMMMSSDSHHISICKDIRTDDSGYVTATPSSAESLLSDSSGNSSLRRSFYRSQNDSIHHFLSTPEEALHPPHRKSRSHRSKPKYLMRDSYPDGSALDKHFSFDSKVTDSKEFRCRTLPVLHEINHEPGQDSILKKEGKSLKRQNAICDDMEWPCEVTTHLVSPLEKHSYITVLQNLAMNEQETLQGHDKRSNYRNSIITSSSSDPSDYSYRSSFMQPECSGSSSKQVFSYNVYPESTPCVSCPITPVKYKKKIRRMSPDESFNESLLRTPEKLEDNFSPIFKFDHPERKSMKKLDFSQQKIGTPEKYQMLYPQLKPVTPPKKIKTPEKIRKSALKASASKCKKSLQLERQNFCGRESIDFLKMLGEEGSHWPAIRCILRNLSCDDLSRVCQVSGCWKSVCQGEPTAERRRKKNVIQKERMKENLMIPKPTLCPKRLDSLPHGVTVRRDLKEIQNHSNVMPLKAPAKPRSPPVSPGKRRFNMFVKAASEDSGGQLRSCPRCGRPARVRGQWALCGARGCGNSFCTRCLTERLPNHPCCQRPIEAPSPSKQAQPKIYIGTKQSRRNLRRL